MRWQRIARPVIAVLGVGFAVGVASNIRQRAVKVVEAPVAKTDPKAVVESESGQTFRVNREREEIRIHYERLVTYPDNTSKMLGINVTTDRGERTFVITANEGQVGKDESTIELDGEVKVAVSDGLVLSTTHATYTQTDGMTRIPGMAQFSRGRMSGSGIGLNFDQAEDILTIVDEARVHVTENANGAGAMEIASGALEFRRREHSMRFDRSMTATRGGQIVSADTAVAHLSDDEQDLQAMELRGQSRINESLSAPGGLETLNGRDVDLKYGGVGQMIEHALINGEAVVQLAGERRQAGRQISANVIEISVAPDGATVKAMTARDNVKVNLPASTDGVARTIAAQALDGIGDDLHGLTSARFSGAVQFAEKGAQIDRAARSATLDVAVGPGFSSISDARFAKGVRFADGALFSTSALARYVLDQGVLELTGSEPGSLTPHIVNDQIAVDATAVEVTLAGPILKASGAVKSVLQPKKADAAASKADLKMPSMLKQDQPVNVTADALDYRGADARAVYTGNALLWQGETQIKAPSISIDSRKGDLDTTGPVATVAMLTQENKDGKKERVRSLATAKRFQYEDAQRRGIYSGEAHMRGPQGDLTADRIELFFKDGGDELDRVEGYAPAPAKRAETDASKRADGDDLLSLRAATRRTTGTRLTYFGDDGRYVVTGAPVKAVDECGRETVGRTLTFYKATDRIVVDGNEQARTQTTGKSNCPGT